MTTLIMFTLIDGVFTFTPNVNPIIIFTLIIAKLKWSSEGQILYDLLWSVVYLCLKVNILNGCILYTFKSNYLEVNCEYQALTSHPDNIPWQYTLTIYSIVVATMGFSGNTENGRAIHHILANMMHEAFPFLVKVTVVSTTVSPLEHHQNSSPIIKQYMNNNLSWLFQWQYTTLLFPLS